MTQPSSLHLDLGQQCTGVTPAPTVASPRPPTSGDAEEALKQRQSQATSDSREPLHDNNSQPSLGGSSSQKRSHTTSQSLAITPSEKRHTMLALSPARPLPLGLTTLEVERVLSLTPGNKPNFRRSPVQQGSQGSTHNGRTSCCLESTPATASPASHKQSGNSRQQTASPQSRPCNQDAPHVMHETCPATEPQLADFPATQLVCAATALDLMMMRTTQVVTADAAACHPKLGVHCNAQHTLHPSSEPALGVKHTEGLEPTPLLQIPAVPDIEAMSHDRAPAGPMTSRAQRQDSTHSKEPAQAAGSPTPMVPVASHADDSKPAARNPRPLASDLSPASTAIANQMLPVSQAEPLVDSAKPGLYHRPGGQQSQLHQRRESEPAMALHPGTAPNLDPSSLATGMDTADATLSQVGVCSYVPPPAHCLLSVLCFT